MAQESETLNIGSLRAGHKRPGDGYAYEPGPAYNADAAARARERIAGAPDHPTLRHPDAIPAARTGDLITDADSLRAAGKEPKRKPRKVVPSAFGPVLAAIGIF